jgi:hypothetical protein
MMKSRLRDLPKHARKYGFWSAVAIACAAFTMIYVFFMLTGANTDE